MSKVAGRRGRDAAGEDVKKGSAIAKPITSLTEEGEGSAATSDECGIERSAPLIAIDGEGHTTKSGAHLYTYMAASNADGSIFRDIENAKGLSTYEILEFLLALPKALVVGFSLGYDQTLWFKDLKNKDIYALYRPDQRQGKYGPRAKRVVVNRRLYSINLVSTRLQIRSRLNKATKRWDRSVVVWDLFKFFQRSFVASLKEWEIGSKEEVERIAAMKAARGSFEIISQREKEYCASEVRLLAQLADKLLRSCELAGLELKDYYGAGSLGAATLAKGPAKAQRVAVDRMHEAFRDAVSRSFFGGRFEHSTVGILEEAFGNDLASAYPYAETQLPCLTCGEWRRIVQNVESHIRSAKVACVHYFLRPQTYVDRRPMWQAVSKGSVDAIPKGIDLNKDYAVDQAFGPFPYRLADGSILFPAEGPGGWAWSYEILAALDNRHVWPNVELKEAWIYESDCSCGHPYLAEVSNYYRQRIAWGKDGRGMVLKKGLASRYGKRAQTVGSAPYHCMVAAGLITSHCRSEILRAIGAASSPWKVAGIATDGIISIERLKLRDPNPTGTEGKKPLGTWEEKGPYSVFLIRPGMRFEIEKIDGRWVPKRGNEGTTAARGVGVSHLHLARQRILDEYIHRPRQATTVDRGSIFHGGKLCVGKGKGGQIRRLPRYGRWTQAEPYAVSYSPLPKRPAFIYDRFWSWGIDQDKPESAAYSRAILKMNRDIMALERAQDEADAQPEGDCLFED